MTDKNYTERLSCSPKTKKRIMKNCIDEFKKHNPEFENFKVTQGMILDRISKHYLKGLF